MIAPQGWIYRIIYFISLWLPSSNARQKRRRANEFATSVQTFADKYSPFAIATGVNAALVALLSLVSFAVNFTNERDSLHVTLGSFVADEPVVAPMSESASAADAEIQRAAQEMLTASPSKNSVNVAALLAATPNSIALPVNIAPPIGPSSETLAGLQAAATTASDDGKAGSPNATNGSARAVGEAAWGATKTVRGNIGPGWSRPGRDSFENQKMILIIDYTLRTPNESRIKDDIMNVVNGLRNRNQILGELSCYSGVMTEKSGLTADTIYGDMKDESGNALTAYSSHKNPRDQDSADCPIADRVNAYWCLRDAIEKYAGQKAVILVISDFVEGSPNSPEEIEFMAKSLIRAELRLFLITVDNAPPPTARILAFQTAGETRRMRVESFAEYLKGKEDAIPWADIDYRPLRHLDKTPAP